MIVEPVNLGYIEEMKPPFKLATPTPPPWMQTQPSSADVKARILAEYAMVFPLVLSKVYAGNTMSLAVRELPIEIDYGAFNRWILKDPGRKALKEAAEEARAEVWADSMVHIASGESADTLERDKFKVDVYKYLMGVHAKKRYGANKSLDVTHTISIAAALAESNQRVIEATVVRDEDDQLLLGEGDEDE